MNSEDNRAELTKSCGKYFLACRMAGASEVRQGGGIGKRGRYTRFKDDLYAKKIVGSWRKTPTSHPLLQLQRSRE